MKKNGTTKVVATLAGGNLLATCIGMAASVIQARLVDPGVLGYFNAFAIASTYLIFSHAGTIDFMYRELPYLIGKGERGTAERYLSTCLGWNLIALGMCSILFIGLASGALIRGDVPATAGWLVQIAVMAMNLYGAYLGTTYRTMHEFSHLAWVSVVQAVLGLVLLAAVFIDPYGGLCIRTVGVSLAGVFLLHRFCPIKVAPGFSFSVFRAAIRSGLPLFVIGYTQTSLQKALEFSVVLHFFGARALGLYAFSNMAITALMIIPSAFNQVYLPRISQRYGEERSVRKCVALSVRPTAVCFGVTLAVTGALAAAFSPAVNLIMPKYADAVPVMIAGAAIVPLRVLWVPALSFYAAGMIVPYGASVMSGAVIFVIASLMAVQAGWGAAGIALAASVGEGGRVLVSYGLLRRAVIREALTT